MPSNKEITWIKDGPYPDKVLDEGDPLGIDAKTHSFYWNREGTQKDDYEPVAILSSVKCGLSRYHFRGLVIWKDYVTKNDKPITSFTHIWHTPIICSKQNVTWSQPTCFIDRIKLLGYLIPKIKQMAKNSESYQQRKYDDKIVEEKVLQKHKFQWSDLTYYVLVAPFDTIEQLPPQISIRVREFLQTA